MSLMCCFVVLMVCGNCAGSGVVAQQAVTKGYIVAQVQYVDSSDVLLKVSYDGGLVPDRKGGHTGHSEFVIMRDGKYYRVSDVLSKSKGTLQTDDLNELISQIDDADFVALKSRKFTETCPSAYDGVEVTYSFHTRKRLEVLASCKVVIDAKSPLFVKVHEILNKYR
jgi:hypothetical protein